MRRPCWSPGLAGRRHSLGVSLIEAMVALAVMAFGTLAVLGVQTTLRMNADVAKQRNEAVRIAQEAIEVARAFAVLNDYDALATSGPDAVDGYATANTVYDVTQTVVNAAADADDPRRKSIVVDVGWADRTGTRHVVTLGSALQRTAPELAGSLSIPADAAHTRNPGGRHREIPPGAVDQGDGSSKFQPPFGGGVGWIFNNVTGYITQRCVADVCTDFDARLLSGFVRFATGAAAPTGLDAEIPPSPALPVGVEVNQTLPVAQAGVVECLEDPQPSWLAYYCAVPVGMETAWSGQSIVTGLALAVDIADPDPGKLRVCRYTRFRAHLIVPAQMKNEEHPLNYVGVNTPLGNQNFLVIRAGDGATAFDCPDDDPATPLVYGRTWHHQPPT